MTANKQQSDIKASYHAMVEAVEEFMVKEGKTIQQAFHAAEEKLADATDASKDSIKQAKNYNTIYIYLMMPLTVLLKHTKSIYCLSGILSTVHYGKSFKVLLIQIPQSLSHSQKT
jgi:hypothetical protein